MFTLGIASMAYFPSIKQAKEIPNKINTKFRDKSL